MSLKSTSTKIAVEAGLKLVMMGHYLYSADGSITEENCDSGTHLSAMSSRPQNKVAFFAIDLP